MARRVVAYTVKVMIERELASLKTKQQHLEILANMVIDLYATDSTLARTVALVQRLGEEATAVQRDMAHVFAASAVDRIADGARRLLANEAATDEELRGHFARLERLVPFFPIRTIAVKTRIAERIVAERGWTLSAG
jgi:hypothetical protein